MEHAARLSKAKGYAAKSVAVCLSPARGALLFPVVLLLGLPLVAFGDSIESTTEIMRVLQRVILILNILLPLVVTLATLVFFWGMVKFLWAAADEKSRESGKGLMVWGIIALFVMISIWGLVGVAGRLFGVGQGGAAPVPGVGAVGAQDFTGVSIPGGGGSI